MAPELLAGAPPTIASDLYAFGVIAFQMLTGSFPESAAKRRKLATADLPTVAGELPSPVVLELPVPEAAELPPTMLDPFTPTRLSAFLPPPPSGESGRAQTAEKSAPSAAASLPPELSHLLQRLLSEQPSERYGDAQAVLRALNAAAGESAPLETVSTLESCLQASQFIGRHVELATLSEAMGQAWAGQGGGWLLGGESGVGKSRLLEELRTMALVEGVLVLRGQAASAGGNAFGLWQGVIRALCLHMEIGALEAGVLKSVVPDLDGLLEQVVAEPPALDAESAQRRQLSTIANLFLRLPAATLVLLEDLHWAAPESLALLERLIPQIKCRRVLIIGSYRDDECPHLPVRLQQMRLLKLQRFDEENTAALCSAVLGPAGQRPEILALLQRETEGNALFAIEAMRALFADSASPAGAGETPLPHSLFARGIKSVLAHRLSRVPPQALPLLQAAAVAGRQLDLNVLRFIEPELKDWLGTCADAAVLEVHEQRFRFSHDKIRECLLDELSPDDKRRIHLQLAEAIERAYPDTPSHAAALAYHYTQAGESTRAARHSAEAGELALKNGALSDALVLLRQALAQHPPTAPLLQRTRVWRNLIKVLVGLGQLSEATALFEEAVLALAQPMPTGVRGWGQILYQGGRQLWHRLQAQVGAQDLKERNDEAQRAELLAALDLYREIVETYGWLGQRLELLYAALFGLNTAEALRHSGHLAYFYPVFGYSVSLLRFTRLSQFYLRQADAACASVWDIQSEASALRTHGLIALLGCRWDRAIWYFQRALPLTQEIGDELLTMFIDLQLASIELHRGDFAAALQRAERMYQKAEQQHNDQYQIWSLVFKALFYVRKGQYSQAQAFLQEAVAGYRHRDALAEICVYGQLALCVLQKGDEKHAGELADKTLKLIESTALTGYGGLDGYSCLIEVYLHLFREAEGAVQRARAYASLLKALRALQRFAASFPIGEARSYFWLGVHAELCRHPRLSRYYLERSLEKSRRHGMPYEEALSLFWLDRPAAAGAIFERLDLGPPSSILRK